MSKKKRICCLCPSGLCIVAVYGGRLLLVEVGPLLVTHRLVKLNASLRFCFVAVGAKQPLFFFFFFCLCDLFIPDFSAVFETSTPCWGGETAALSPSLCSGSSQ